LSSYYNRGKGTPGKIIFDFEAKYQGKSTETTPADLDEASADKIRDEAKKIYRVFNCREW
jgi:D-alanine-D-alanine ligase